MACSQTPPEDRLYALSREILDTRCLEKNTLEANNLAIHDVLAVVYRAVADSAFLLSEKAPHLLLRFPVELRVSCLSWLSVPELVTASHVSRSRRDLILSSPTLWSSVSAQTRSSDYLSFVKRREILASRSGSGPLDFRVILIKTPIDPAELNEAVCLSSRLRVLLDSVMHRIRSLNMTIYHKLSAHPDASAHPMLWRVPAPMLESITIFDCEHHVRIPDCWWQSCVPKLRVLRLRLFELPAVPDLSNHIQVFECAMRVWTKTSDMCQLFVHFPRLVSVTVTEVDAISLLHHTRLPACLRDISIQSAWSRYRDDLAPLISLWRTSPSLRSLTVDFFPHFTLNDAVRFYAGSVPWELVTPDTHHRPHLTLRDAGGLCLAVSLRNVPQAPSVDDPPHFRTLRALTLSSVWLSAFLRARLELPALVSLALHGDLLISDRPSVLPFPVLQFVQLPGFVSPTPQGYLNLDDIVPAPSPLRLPALQFVTFTEAEAQPGVLPGFIGRWLRYDAPLLQRIAVAPRRARLAEKDVLALRALAVEFPCEQGTESTHDDGGDSAAGSEDIGFLA